MSSANNGALNSAHHVASRKRKCSCRDYQVGSSSKKVLLELFPSHPTQNPASHVSQSTAMDHDTNDGQNGISSSHHYPCSGHFTNHDDTYLQLCNVQSRSEDAQEDPIEKLFKTQYENMRETCKQYFEERASRIRKDKDMQMAEIRSMITHLEEKLASDSAKVEELYEVINNRNTELDNTRRRNKELEEQVEVSKSELQVWKEKAESVEEMVWNMSSPRLQGRCCEVEEGRSSSSVGDQ